MKSLKSAFFTSSQEAPRAAAGKEPHFENHTSSKWELLCYVQSFNFLHFCLTKQWVVAWALSQIVWI